MYCIDAAVQDLLICMHTPFLPYMCTYSVHVYYVCSVYIQYMENMCIAIEKEREIVKEETALRKEKEAVCCYVHVDVHVDVHTPVLSWSWTSVDCSR